MNTLPSTSLHIFLKILGTRSSLQGVSFYVLVGTSARRTHMRSSAPLALNLFPSAYCLAVVSSARYFVEDYFVVVTAAVSGAANEEREVITKCYCIITLFAKIESNIEKIS